MANEENHVEEIEVTEIIERIEAIEKSVDALKTAIGKTNERIDDVIDIVHDLSE